MILKKCTACKKELLTRANKCPNCGQAYEELDWDKLINKKNQIAESYKGYNPKEISYKHADFSNGHDIKFYTITKVFYLVVGMLGIFFLIGHMSPYNPDGEYMGLVFALMMFTASILGINRHWNYFAFNIDGIKFRFYGLVKFKCNWEDIKKLVLAVIKYQILQLSV